MKILIYFGVVLVLAVIFAISTIPPIAKGIIFFLGIFFAGTAYNKYAKKKKEQNKDNNQNEKKE